MELDAGDLVLILGVIFILVFAFYSGKKEYEKFDKQSKKPEEHVFQDVEIILADGTLYKSYKKILITHFSERIYKIYTLIDEEKILIEKFHLGENMMLVVRNSEL